MIICCKENPMQSTTKIISLYWPFYVIREVPENERIEGIHERFIYKNFEDKILWDEEGDEYWNLDTMIHLLWEPNTGEFTIEQNRNELIVDGIKRWINNPPSGEKNTNREDELPCSCCYKIFKRKKMIFDVDPWDSEINHNKKKIWLCKDCYHNSVCEI